MLDENQSIIPYSTSFGSVWFMIEILLNSSETDSFDIGNASMKGYLYCLYLISSLLIVILMLNMLIAIMGDTFSKRKEFGKQITIKDHLGYVMDNWYQLDDSFPQRGKIKYIITAYSSDEITGEKQMLQQLQEDLEELKRVINSEAKNNSHNHWEDIVEDLKIN